MEESILKSTKKILNLAPSYTAFDPDVITFINGALATAEQAGAGFTTTFAIDDDSTNWNDLGLSPRNTALLKNYVYLKVRLLFDPPGTSFALDAMKEQIAEMEYRLRTNRELEEAGNL